MTRITLPSIALLLAATASPGAAEDTTSDSMIPQDSGRYERTFSTDGLDLRWAVDVPADLDAREPRPLVLALHYGFDRGQPFPPYYGKGFLERVVAPGIRDLGAVIVAPDSHGYGWSNPAIAKPVLALLDHLVADPRIDGARVVVTGYSMGGAGTWWFAAEHGDRFAAAVAMASFVELPTAKRAAAAVPFYVIHSQIDELVGIEPIRKVVKALRKAGTAVELVEVEDVPHFQSPRFAEPLRDAVPWLRKALDREP